MFRATLALIVTLALAPAAAAQTHELRHGGVARTYALHVPASYGGRPMPLVLVLHGGGGTGPQVARVTGFSDLADREGFIVAYPSGLDRGWNDSRTVPGRAEPDDVGFLAALVEHLARTYAIDRQRVYATGISNGGFMSYRLACERADLVAAIGPVAGLMPEPLRCAPSRPVSVVQIHGTEDGLVPWAGGTVARNRGRTLSVADTMALWARLNGCPQTPQVAQEPDRDPRDGTRVRRESYAPCRAGTAVVLYAVEGGGHTWPGRDRSRLPFLGRLSRDLDATETVWAFFKAHPRR